MQCIHWAQVGLSRALHAKLLWRNLSALTQRAPSAGFNISLEPGFSVSRLCWMLAYGGVYAVANLRCASGFLSSVILTPCQQAVHESLPVKKHVQVRVHQPRLASRDL